MITGDNKNKVDQIWQDLWTAGITNSITVMEQITYLLFMKMLDDAQLSKEQKANAYGIPVKKPIFKEGLWHNPDTNSDVAYRQLRWSSFKLLADPEERYRLVRNDVFAFIKNINESDTTAYSKFMSDAQFSIPNARALTKAIAGIDSLDCTDLDMMGDVYEYILGKMAESGTNGQFRTPRHIIRMMVELMEPTIDDSICDPAMGSAGFLVECAKYINEQYHDMLAESDASRYFRTKMFNGFDTDTTMLRIGAMNLTLHNVDDPHVEYRDSLSQENTDKDLYTLCMANPPFTGSIDKEMISKSLKTITDTKKTELLFMSLFIRMLKAGGRCASIVPDGVLFGTTKAHKSLRQNLVDKQTLQAVISMPSGVFQPYSGVSTAILIFTKTNTGGTDKVWFYDMRADGFTLDQRRTPCRENDIPDIIRRFHNLDGEASRLRKEQSFLVSADEIRANDYDLSINKYKEVEREKIEYEQPDVIFSRIAQREQEITRAFNELKEMLR